MTVVINGIHHEFQRFIFGTATALVGL